MSIYEDDKKGNIASILTGKNAEKFIIMIIFICFCLISFALGRISAFEQFGAKKGGITIHNSEVISP